MSSSVSSAEGELMALRAQLAGFRYLLSLPPPWYADREGRVWVDRLLARDLLRHLDYISDLTILAPRLPLPDPIPDTMQCLPDMPGLRFVPMPSGTSALRGLLKLPSMVAVGISEVSRADVVHSSVAGWPVPPGFAVNPVAIVMRKPLVIVVESAFWRGDGSLRGLAGTVMGNLTEWLARWSSRRAALAVFTHGGYARELAQGARGRVMVAPATWIDAADVLTETEAADAWSMKPGIPRFLLAARLTRSKGIDVALAALQAADARGQPIMLDIIGDGDLAPEVHAAAERLQTVRLRHLAPVSYGRDFFALLRTYHAAVVPTLSDEQPRILYDAFSQAVPVLASDTAGHREAVIPGQTGGLFRSGDPASLLETLIQAAATPDRLKQMGMAARQAVTGQTHQAMHVARARALVEVLTGSAVAGP